MKKFNINDKIEEKIIENKFYIKYTYYELRVKEDLKEYEMYSFIAETVNELIKRKYKIYRTHQEYYIDRKKYIVKDNELLVAIKDI